MSAQANLMGLYPNSHPEIPWKPIPIHTVPTKYDKLLKPPTRSCQRYQQLMEETINLPSYQAKLREWKGFMEKMANYTGLKSEQLTLRGLWKVHDTLFCQHDSTLIALQAALGVYSGRPPPYAACHGFEFYQEGNNSFSVAMFYRNRSDQRPHILPLPGCPTPCPLPLFIHLTRTAVPEDWDAECQNPQSGPGRAVIALATTVGVLSVALIGMGVLYWRR
ncbi:testicular acid phosphatase [Crotalus adamanteus]|uniref:Testicular acid phosphatase n=1 Tax=Crotalus adamanteus TaxID=8729 RepID=A0AAW1B6F3_CROAD